MRFTAKSPCHGAGGRQEASKPWTWGNHQRAGLAEGVERRPQAANAGPLSDKGGVDAQPEDARALHLELLSKSCGAALNDCLRNQAGTKLWGAYRRMVHIHLEVHFTLSWQGKCLPGIGHWTTIGGKENQVVFRKYEVTRDKVSQLAREPQRLSVYRRAA